MKDKIYDFYEGCWKDPLPSPSGASKHEKVPHTLHAEVNALELKVTKMEDHLEALEGKVEFLYEAAAWLKEKVEALTPKTK